MLRHFETRAVGRVVVTAALCASAAACGVKGPLVPAPKPTPAPAATAPAEKPAPEPTTPNQAPQPETTPAPERKP